MQHKMIKLIALDLDGTTLKNNGQLEKKTKTILEATIARNVQVVIATGRVLSALPKEMLEIKGISYALTSNGANIVDLNTREPIYTNFINAAAVETVVKTLREYDFMTEVFTGGHAYVERAVYEDVQENGSAFKNTDYLLATREPVENLLDYILLHKDSIENINLNFKEQKDRMMMKNVLREISDISITSSFDYNLEICGMSTCKAEALRQLCEILGITANEVMACGDSHNDIEMLKFVGLPVAVGNAKDQVKAVAKYIAPTNDENGVAEAIERLIL